MDSLTNTNYIYTIIQIHKHLYCTNTQTQLHKYINIYITQIHKHKYTNTQTLILQLQGEEQQEDAIRSQLNAKIMTFFDKVHL